MSGEYADDDFILGLPLWFVVDERATELAPEGHRDLIKWDARAFCGGTVDGSKCIMLFTDNDLAERHAQRFPDCVPLGCNKLSALIELLEKFRNDFHSVIIDIGPEPLTNKRIPIPKFLAEIRKPS